MIKSFKSYHNIFIISSFLWLPTWMMYKCVAIYNFNIFFVTFDIFSKNHWICENIIEFFCERDFLHKIFWITLILIILHKNGDDFFITIE